MHREAAGMAESPDPESVRDTNNLFVSFGTMDDLEVLARHRMEMWKDIFPDRMEKILESKEESASWVAEQIRLGRYISFIVRSIDGIVAGSGAIWIREEPPKPGKNGTHLPYLLSMYTEKAFRRRGVASMIVEEAIKWSRENGFYRIYLHASPFGRGVYEKLGFSPGNEMRLELE